MKMSFTCELCGKSFNSSAECLTHESEHATPVEVRYKYEKGDHTLLPSRILCRFESGTTAAYTRYQGGLK
jgi:hypothetical protein